MSEKRKKLLLAGLLVLWPCVTLFLFWDSIAQQPPVEVPRETDPLRAAMPARESTRLHVLVDWIDTPRQSSEMTRDPFVTVAAAAAAAAVAAGRPAPTDPATQAAIETARPAAQLQLRYHGYVQVGPKTMALLRDSSQMYLVPQGERIGPGYLVALIDAEFVEVEYQGRRQRIPLTRPEGGGR